MTVREWLIESKARLTEDSWRQGTYNVVGGKLVGGYAHDDGTYCAQEAILVPNWGDRPSTYIRHGALRALKNVVGGSAIYWNDTPGRTLAEVHEGFDQAIEAA